MTLEMIYIGGTILVVLLVLGALLALILYLYQLHKIRQLLAKKFRRKKRRRMQKKQHRILMSRKKRYLRWFVFLSVISGAGFAGTLFLSNYQGTHLTTADGSVISKAHFYLLDLENQLQQVSEQTIEKEKFESNIRILTSNIASVGLKQASKVNTTEGQAILNRYYTSLKELGINGSAQVGSFYDNPDLLQDYLTDTKKVSQNEQAVMSFYKIDKSHFKESK
ncbi:hypothetical protein [Enterococcus rivorum]|uniref:Uncharacterized protein n=2 Tax=Enterococcus rivorum TaxID=762845 RepID=A0A1E5KUX5_9ENTE|nr:hypothetical protein [Enterococcus rivorum]MBP2100542.1 hypothetical protein [Enterococcus rivorum]OEH81588.1 hypothetical protein BCR26_16290 [Enterococcus rivorum]